MKYMSKLLLSPFKLQKKKKKKKKKKKETRVFKEKISGKNSMKLHSLFISEQWFLCGKTLLRFKTTCNK